MISLKEIADRVTACSTPAKIILFGSRARGDADLDSDLDLVVIYPQIKDRGRMMLDIRRAIGSIGVGVDVLVYSEAEVSERHDWSSTALYWALREGKVLYDTASVETGAIA